MEANLKKQLAELPNQPGVYLFSDKRRKLLYVGKATNLRNRVRSYFQNTNKGPRIRNMVAQIAHVEIVLTRSPAEALLLENSFIKNNKPYFNVLLRDDKTYPYIKITEEPFPRVVFTRRRHRGDGRYFGPFPSARAARQSINLIHKHFKVRSCDLSLGNHSYRPCLQFYIKRCEAPCQFLVEPGQYQEGVERAALFLAGKTDDLACDIAASMKQASGELAFERAAYFRDLLGLVSSVQRNQQVASLAYDRLDVVTYTLESWHCLILILAIRGGTIVRSSQFRVEWSERAHHELADWLSHYYLNHEDPPEEVVIEDTINLELLSDTLREARQRKLTIHHPQRGTKKRLLAMAHETLMANAAMQRQEDQEHPGVSQLADLLDLGKMPNHIECFDISNTLGQQSVAAMVCFKDGKPNKSMYRKFNIKTVVGANDFASMAEVVGRRYRRLLDEGKPLPDLIMVDGGLGQLHAAHEALCGLGLGQHPLISLAKREEWVYRVGSSEPLIIPHHEPALRMLQHLRDESHRFGITFHRKKRAKTMLSSELDGIPGLGPKRTHKLLHHFGSVKRIRDADEGQIADVIGKKLAQAVLQHLR